MVILQYYARLSTVPGLREEMVYKSGLGQGKPVRDDAADQAAMAYAEGWDIDDYEDDSEDEKSERDNGKVSAKEDVKMEETAVALSSKSVSPLDDQSEKARL